MKHYQEVVDQIIKKLESGVVPWKQPWTSFPKNFSTNKEYQGINTLILNLDCRKSNLWGTVKQINDAGGRLKQGVGFKHKKIFFWSQKNIESMDDLGEITESKIPILKFYIVYNLEDTVGLEHFLFAEDKKEKTKPNIKVDSIINNLPEIAKINYGSRSAFYVPSLDEIHIPGQEKFGSDSSFYSTLFHELVHWTGVPMRLNRFNLDHGNHKRGEAYSREELVAELGSSFLMAECEMFDLDTLNNSSAYLNSWINFLKEDPRSLIVSANRAQRAVDYILGRKREGQ